MEVFYKVGEQVFSNREDAANYEKNLKVANAKFSIGSDVYFWNSKNLVKSVITSIGITVDGSSVCYGVQGLKTKKMESSLYASVDEYIETIKNNIINY